jgi:cyclic dehypoxanthinyl futalosine synthase
MKPAATHDETVATAPTTSSHAAKGHPEAPSAAEVDAILGRVVDGARMTPEEALLLFHSHDLSAIGQAAHEVRLRRHPHNVVTYNVDRNINYSNVCVATCTFCGFYDKPGGERGYVLPREVVGRKIEELQAIGGNQVLMQGGMNPDLKLEWFEDFFRWMKAKYGVHLHALSPPEIVVIARMAKLSLRDTIARLRDAGLDSIPGGGAEILDTPLRREISRGKCSAEEWLDVMRQAHLLGMRSSATMMFGHVETLRQRVEHLDKLRALQDETAGFTAFICWTYQNENVPLEADEVGSFEYLKTTAIARLYLDNFDHMQSSWVTQGPKVGQVALWYGCDDMGSTMMEENVVSEAGCIHSWDAQGIELAIRRAGFEPRRRDFFYRWDPESVLVTKPGDEIPRPKVTPERSQG